MTRLDLPLAVVFAVAKRPSLWATAVKQAWRFRPSSLFSSPRAYVSFRMQTQYGSHPPLPTPGPAQVAEDTVSYLAWCRVWNSEQRQRRGQ
jgi:hypothetical protein